MGPPSARRRGLRHLQADIAAPTMPADRAPAESAAGDRDPLGRSVYRLGSMLEKHPDAGLLQVAGGAVGERAPVANVPDR
jgi:hypothetical protein